MQCIVSRQVAKSKLLTRVLTVCYRSNWTCTTSIPRGLSHGYITSFSTLSCQRQLIKEKVHLRSTHSKLSIQTRSKVFVSKHNSSLNVTSSQIQEYCNSHGIPTDSNSVRTTPTHVILRECPFCTKPTADKPDNLFKLYVQVGGGAYFCHRCGAKGSWYDFKMRLGGFDVVDVGGRSVSVSNENQVFTSATAINIPRNNRRAAGRTSNIAKNSGANLNPPSSSCLPMPSQRLQAAYITNLLDRDSQSEVHQNRDNQNGATNSALEYLTKDRGLTKQTLRKYGVGLAKYNFPSSEPGQHGRYIAADCITFPWIMRASEVQEQESLRGGTYDWIEEEDHNSLAADTTHEEKRSKKGKKAEHPLSSSTEKNNLPKGPFITRRIKARALDNKSWQRLDPPGGGWGLFGWHTIPPTATSIVITEGEYDAMAVYQATGRPAVSLPNGCRSLPVQVLPMLERFDKIYLWMDNDGPGREGAEVFAKKIGVNRCFLVQPSAGNLSESSDKECEDENEEETALPPPKDANEALLKGMNLEDMILEAEVVPHERILTFAELRAQVMHEIFHPDKYTGVNVPSLPGLTNIIKGFRRGEMTVLTGPTGSGKTTFLGQLSLDFAEQGINTLWGSFEIKNTRLMHKLLQQYSREPLPIGKQELLKSLDSLADRFENLPLYFMKFHGGSDVDDVLDAMDYAVYVHDVEHIILDNMQFMITRNLNSWSTFDKFDMQDVAVEKFRKFATEKNVHVTLVVHPRKEDEGVKLGISSIYGSAKATQEADTVLILQHDGKRKYVEVKKNRFDGTLGHCTLHFQRRSGRYSEQPDASVPEQNYSRSQPVLKKSVSSTEKLVGSPRRTVAKASSVPDNSPWKDILE